MFVPLGIELATLGADSEHFPFSCFFVKLSFGDVSMFFSVMENYELDSGQTYVI